MFPSSKLADTVSANSVHSKHPRRNKVKIVGTCHLLARGLARWLVWRSGAYSPQRPKAAGMRPVACGPMGRHQPSMPRSRSSPGSDARHRSPDVILGFAEYALLSHIYLPVFLSLLFRQSLLYNSQFNISIRTRLILTPSRTGKCHYKPSRRGLNSSVSPAQECRHR
jgi:hypothetical protein